MRVFLVGLSEGFARSLARLVCRDRRVVLTGVTPSVALASMLLPLAAPDLALLDWAALNGATGDAMTLLRAGRPGLRIVCVVTDADAYRPAAMRAGADALISRDGFAAELEPILRGYFPERFALAGERHER